MVALIDRDNQEVNPSEWVLSGSIGEYQVEVGVGNRTVTAAPAESDLGTASWSFGLGAQGEISSRSFVVDGIAGTTDAMVGDLPSEILVSPLTEATPETSSVPDASSVPGGSSSGDCAAAVAAMAPLDLTVAVAGPDIQYAAEVAFRVGNVLAGLK